MKLEKINKLPDNIRPRGEAANLLYDFYEMGCKFAKVIPDEGKKPTTLRTMLANELLKKWQGRIRMHFTEDEQIILERHVVPKFEVTLRDKTSNNRRSLIVETYSFRSAEYLALAYYDSNDEELIKIEKEYDDYVIAHKVGE